MFNEVKNLKEDKNKIILIGFSPLIIVTAIVIVCGIYTNWKLDPYGLIIGYTFGFLFTLTNFGHVEKEAKRMNDGMEG